MKNGEGPLILSVGGGKGGVGKSMVSSNLAVQYAQAGLQVILIDLDVGAANLHTIFGMRNPAKGLGNYFTTPRSQLSDYLVPTSVPNLLLVPGSGFIPEMADIKYVQKVKLINQIKGLKSDLVLLDLGAGSSNNVIDFFSMTDAGIVVTTPEPTAIINAYEFLKNIVYRILYRAFRNQEKILEIIKTSALPENELKISTLTDLMEAVKKSNPWAAQTIKEICEDLDFYLIFNQARKWEELQLGSKLHDICQKYLNIHLSIGGILFYNEEVSASVFKMSPISLSYPNSPTSQSLKRIATSIFSKVMHRLTHHRSEEPFPQQFAKITQQAKKDFELNILTQSRFRRAKEKSISLPIYEEDEVNK